MCVCAHARACVLLKLGFTPCKTEQPLQGLGLQEKQENQIKGKQESCLERALKWKYLLIVDV